MRVSTERQQRAQTIEQRVVRLRAYVDGQDGWRVADEHIFRDDGYSGAKLSRPGLDALRDQAARAAFDRVLITAPDRLARNYVHEMVMLEELERLGCPVQFIGRPMSDDPHDQLETIPKQVNLVGLWSILVDMVGANAATQARRTGIADDLACPRSVVGADRSHSR